MKRRLRWLAGLAVVGSMIACADSETPAESVAVTDESTDASEVLAKYDGGQVTAEDLDRAILELPPESREVPGDRTAWYEGLIRTLALDQIEGDRIQVLLDQDGELKELLRDAEKGVLIEEWARRQSLEIDPVSEDELRAYYQEHQEVYQIPDRRSVSHIFLRADRRSAGEIQQRLHQIRERILQGESFETLVAEVSESETRHRSGLLGSLGRGDLPQDLEKVIFELEVGTPSEPVLTPQGGHLFIVMNSVQARDYSFEEVRPAMQRQMMFERREAALEELTRSLPLPPDLERVSSESLEALISQGDPSEIVLEVGQESTSLGRLMEFANLAAVARNVPPNPVQALDLLERQERILARALEDGIDQLPEVAQRLRSVRWRVAREKVHSSRREAILDRDPDRLRAYYEEHQLAFRTPLSLRLRRLSIPFARDGVASLMAELETAVASQPESLEDLLDRFEGSIDDVGWLELSQQLTEAERRLAAVLAPLEAGQLSPPRRFGEALEVYRVLDRREPRDQPYEVVSETVREVYLLQHSAELQAEWTERRLSDQNFRLVEGWQERVGVDRTSAGSETSLQREVP